MECTACETPGATLGNGSFGVVVGGAAFAGCGLAVAPVVVLGAVAVEVVLGAEGCGGRDAPGGDGADALVGDGAGLGELVDGGFGWLGAGLLIAGI